jgi:hypothetical protein
MLSNSPNNSPWMSRLQSLSPLVSIFCFLLAFWLLSD